MGYLIHSDLSSKLEILSEAKEHPTITPIGTILAWTPKPEKTSTNMVDLPRGWMFCNGSDITEGPWKGGKTPDLNSIGAFLRGGSEDLVLEMEDSQMEDHNHEDS